MVCGLEEMVRRLVIADFDHPDCKDNVNKHVAGVVANFVHGIDGAHCAKSNGDWLRESGYRIMATIHDSLHYDSR